MTETRRRLLNLVALMLLGAAAGYLLFWQLGRGDEKIKREEEETRLFAIPDLSAVRRLTLTSATGRIVVEKLGEPAVWEITAPRQTAAEASTVDALVRSVGTLKRIRRVGEKGEDGQVTPPAELWMFGLAPPRFTIALEAGAGAAWTLEVGKRNNFDGSIYVKRGDAPEVAQVEGSIEYQVDKDLYALRDKRLVRFDEAAVTSVRGATAAGNYLLVRVGEGWELREPLVAPADTPTVTGLISAVTNLRAKEFVSEAATAAQLAELGLARPRARLELGLGDGPPTGVLLGEVKVKEETRYFAAREGESPILELGSNWALSKVVTSADGLRDKRVLPFDRDADQRLELRRGEKQVAFAKRHDAEKNLTTWRLTSPRGAEADAAAVSGILYRLANLRAERIVTEAATPSQLADAELDTPEVEIELGGTDGQTLGRLRFAHGDAGDWLVTSGDGRRIDLIDGALLEDLSVDAADYEEKPVDAE
jgi:hypothetical protein